MSTKKAVRPRLPVSDSLLVLILYFSLYINGIQLVAVFLFLMSHSTGHNIVAELGIIEEFFYKGESFYLPVLLTCIRGPVQEMISSRISHAPHHNM